MIFFMLFQYVFKTESYSTNNSKTVHEELAKAMTSILKPSTDFLTSNKLLKVLKTLSDLTLFGLRRFVLSCICHWLKCVLWCCSIRGIFLKPW